MDVKRLGFRSSDLASLCEVALVLTLLGAPLICNRFFYFTYFSDTEICQSQAFINDDLCTKYEDVELVLLDATYHQRRRRRGQSVTLTYNITSHQTGLFRVWIDNDNQVDKLLKLHRLLIQHKVAINREAVEIKAIQAIKTRPNRFGFSSDDVPIIEEVYLGY